MHNAGTVNQQVFSMLYLSLVRPILEYCIPVWSPYLVKRLYISRKKQSIRTRPPLRHTVRRPLQNTELAFCS